MPRTATLSPPLARLGRLARHHRGLRATNAESPRAYLSIRQHEVQQAVQLVHHLREMLQLAEAELATLVMNGEQKAVSEPRFGGRKLMYDPHREEATDGNAVAS